MNQATLFDYPIAQAVSRPSAGSSAQEAADDMNESGNTRTHEDMVINALSGTHMTAPEVGQYTGLGHIEAQRRLSGLYRKGVVIKNGTDKCSIIGKVITVWKLSD